MQLSKPRLGRVSGALGALTANLLAATAAHPQDASQAQPSYADAPAASADSSAADDTQTDVGLTRIDTAVLFYQEAGGRVQSTEPVVSATLNGSSGDILTARLTTDILTGATPNGAAPWKASQTFITPAHAPGKTTSVTTSSGGSTLVTIPGTGLVTRQYTAQPNTLPVDSGFKDFRYALDVGYSTLLTDDTRASFGGTVSTERDYSSYAVNAGISQDLFQRKTTLSLAGNFEFDISRPYFGTPTPFTVMSAAQKGPNGSKTVASAVVGVTQVMDRYWLAQLNYSVGLTSGYQTDPYRVLSMVDGTTGAPSEYLYEARPRSRLRQSVYFGNKLAIGPTFVDLSARVYDDSWGIKSLTAEISDRIPITSRFYVEPDARYYSQTAADFFRNYLIAGQTMPQFASSDSRLDKFSAITVGAKAGFNVTGDSELYLQVEDYRQTGNAHPAGVVPGLAGESLFSGVNAISVIVGYTFAFF